MGDKKFIFIQTPDDMDREEAEELLFDLKVVGQLLEPRYTFVLCPIGYKAMEEDEIRRLLAYLREQEATNIS
jgi:hypothetical protein